MMQEQDNIDAEIVSLAEYIIEEKQKEGKIALSSLVLQLAELIPVLKSLIEKPILPPVVNLPAPIVNVEVPKIDVKPPIVKVPEPKVIVNEKDYSQEFNSMQSVLVAILAVLSKERKEEIKNPPYSKHLGRGTGNPSQIANISSQADGSTTVFTIPANKRVQNLHYSSAPFSAWIQDTDYTVSGTSNTILTITGGPTPEAGQTLLVEYVQ